PQNDVTLKMPAFEWVHVQLHQQKGMISLSPPTICNSAQQTMVGLSYFSAAWIDIFWRPHCALGLLPRRICHTAALALRTELC
ncbi:hypothetical protein N7246_24825, partial [Escherichia coli]|uniref:hypothetical protein n=1 Tax=Escherichia coli TaxID=562 RepID=UPI0021BF9D09